VSARFLQHVFSGAPLGTAAESEGLAREEREALEREAMRYDLQRAAIEYRAVPLARAGDDQARPKAYAFSTSWPVHAVRGNNYLTHAYVVREDQLGASSANWAWLTLRLPGLGDFRPSRASMDRLPVLETPIDPVPPFRFFRFVTAEQTAPRAAAAIEAVLRHVARREGGALDLDLGPPHAELPALLPLTLAGTPRQPPAVPGADELTLYRMVGLLAPLPAVFQLEASYVLNGAPADGARALVIRTGSSPSELPPARLLYVRRCVALAEDRSEEALRELQQMRDWVGRFLTVPSVETLEAACAFYDAVRGRARADAPIEAAALASMLTALADGQGVPLAELLEAVATLGVDRRSLAERLAVWRALAPAVAREAAKLPFAVRDDLLDGLASHEPPARGLALELFGRLSHEQQRQVWLTAEARLVPPASGASPALQLQCLTPALLAGDRDRIDRLVASLDGADDARRAITPEERVTARLRAVAEVDATVSPAIAAIAVARLLRVGADGAEPVDFDRFQAVRSLVRAPDLFTRGRREQVSEVVALAIQACWRASDARGQRVLALEVPSVERREDMARALGRLVALQGLRTRIVRLVEVQQELLLATLEARRSSGTRQILLQLPRYGEAIEVWREELRVERQAPAGWPELYVEVHRHLVEEVNRARPPVAVLLGASYLSHFEGQVALLASTMARVPEIPWLDPVGFETRALRATVLAELFAASETCQRVDLMEGIAEVLAAPSQEAEALALMVGGVLGQHRRDPPAWRDVEKRRRGRGFRPRNGGLT
jgi:hypothetical protein